jgi:hypothetical protein
MDPGESTPSRTRRGFSSVLALMVALTCTEASGAHGVGDDVAALADTRSPEMRVATIGYRLATVNAQRCGRTAPVTGLLLHELGSYDESLRAQVTARYGLGDGIGVLGVVPGSAADDAGLMTGDEIGAIGGQAIAELHLPAMHPTATYERVEAFTKIVAAQLARGPLALSIRRGGETRSVTLAPQYGCAAPVVMVEGSKPDAWSDAHYAAVTQGLVRVAGDDELAFALAHEMAHIVLDHAAEPHGSLVGLGIGGKRSRDRERAADRLGIAMTLAAGYDERGAEALLERFARVNAPGISLTHPSVKARIAAIRQAAAGLSAGQP